MPQHANCALWWSTLVLVTLVSPSLTLAQVRTGVLSDDRMKLDYVLGLKIEDFLERRLQTQVIFKLWQPSP